jgi:beta-1,2-mannobiose phosphorylase / 1,2-beta-oligomannan phosphorylase
MTKPHVEKLGILLSPTQRKFESRSVLNPGVYQDGNTIHMLYRAIDSNFLSTIGYAKLKGATAVVERSEKPVITPTPTQPSESHGTEDPRITKLENTIYITYVAHDGENALTSLATTKNFKTFTKKGVITPRIKYDTAAELFREEQLKDEYFMFEAFYEEFSSKDMYLWSKDVILFPKKINGKFALFNRILPDIQIIYADRLEDLATTTFWEEYLKNLADFVVLENKYWFESRHIGGGPPPIETPDGWLTIFHSTEQSNKKKVYHASAALLDINDPTKIIGRLREPLFSPEEEWEVHGFVSNVVFPTGTAIFGDDLYIYYGAADQHVCVAKTSLSGLINTLKNRTR